MASKGRKLVTTVTVLLGIGVLVAAGIALASPSQAVIPSIPTCVAVRICTKKSETSVVCTWVRSSARSSES